MTDENGSAAGRGAPPADRLFAGAGDMRARCRALDWAATPLGPVEAWPTSLRTTAALVLAAPTPMILLWGLELVQLYNDGYAAIMGAKHPAGLGQRNVECWPEVWDFTRPVCTRVREQGEAFTFTDQRLVLERRGHPEEAFFALTYSPVFDEAGGVGGVLVTVVETTARVRARSAREEERERLLTAERATAAELRAVIESMSDAVYIGGASGITLANQAALDQLGFASREELDRSVGTLAEEIRTRDAATGEFIPAERQAFTRALGGERVVQDVIVRHRTLGEDRVVRCAAAPVLVDGRVVAAVAVNTDVTDAVHARREAERLLGESEAARRQVTATLESIGDAFYAVDRDFRFTYVNHQAEVLWGRSREALLGRHYWTEFPQAVGSEAHRRHLAVMAERRPAHFEAVSPIVGRWVDVSLYPDEATGGLACYFRDVAERKEAEARLREAEERYLALFTAIDQGFCTLEVRFDAEDRPVDYRFLEVSPSFERQTGIVNGAGRWMRDIAPDQDAHWFEIYGRVARTGEPARFEEHSTPLGRWWSVYAFRIGDPALRRVGVLFHDITERKQAEAERTRLVAELDAERARLRSVILHTPAPLALLEGPEHRFVLVNDAYKRISGGGRDVTGLTPPEAFPELEGKGIHELFDQVYETGEPWDGPETLVRYDRDGAGVQDTWFNLRFEPVRDVEGRVAAILNFAVDVTEQVRARRQVEALLRAERATRAEAEEARRAAEAANRAKSEFLAVMSHELRTPLNAIGGYAELIELGIHGPVTEAQRTALDRIQTSQRHLLGLIAGVLDYSRVEAGAVTYRIVDVPVTEAVAEAETLVAPQLRAKGLGYAWSGAPPGLRVRADREKLQQILLNLLGNAVKFTYPRDGVPGRIEVACTVEGAAGGDGEAAGRLVRLHVRDTGEGIAPEELERVFEPFVQADQRLTRPHAGVGLGLAISRDLARGMGGDLTVESTPGVGSAFTLVLPATR